MLGLGAIEKICKIKTKQRRRKRGFEYVRLNGQGFQRGPFSQKKGIHRKKNKTDQRGRLGVSQALQRMDMERKFPRP